MTRRGPPLPIGLQLLGIIGGLALCIGVVFIVTAGAGEGHPLVGIGLAVYLGTPALMAPLAVVSAIWQKRHPGCFDEVDPRDALMEMSQ